MVITPKPERKKYLKEFAGNLLRPKGSNTIKKVEIKTPIQITETNSRRILKSCG
jgi:hypothetical protein